MKQMVNLLCVPEPAAFGALPSLSDGYRLQSDGVGDLDDLDDEDVDEEDDLDEDPDAKEDATAGDEGVDDGYKP